MASISTQVFLSYSHNDRQAAERLRHALAQAGLDVFKDDASLHAGDRWLTRLQQAVAGCTAFVVLVGRDGVHRWVGAEVEVALNRYLSPQSDQSRLPIFPVLLGDTAPDSLPPFLALFQATRWDGETALAVDLIDALHARCLRFDTGSAFEGPPFLGLSAFRLQDARLFFGRRRETLEALGGLGDQSEGHPERLSGFGGNAYKRWLQIEGNSGSGKSSLVQAGLLPMVKRGALWARTGFDAWTVLGPMMPGRQPVEKLAEVLECGLVGDPARRDILGRLRRLEQDERALAFALRDHRQPAGSGRRAFLLVVDQLEELFTFTEDAPRRAFDALLAHALQDQECPLFVISTVRADFLDRFEQLPRLGSLYNSLCKRYFLPSISEHGLREVIEGPAQLAGLDVSEVLAAILKDARDEMAGALPLVENALLGLWETRRNGRLSGDDYHSRGGLAGMLASQADALINAIEAEKGMADRGRTGALELLLALTRINDGGRHTRQRISRREALIVAGNGRAEVGERILRRLSGERAEDVPANTGHGGLRLIVAATGEEAPSQPIPDASSAQDGYVDLIHETLIRARGKDGKSGKPVGYWPTLYDYIEANRDRDLSRQQLRNEVRRWQDSRWLGRWWNLAVFGDWLRYRRLRLDRSSPEGRFVRWSGVALLAQTSVGALVLGGLAVLVEATFWAKENGLPNSYILHKPLWLLGLSAPLPEMVDIPPGRFTMGCKPGRDDVEGAFCAEGTSREVTMDKPYALGMYEVTFLQYDYYVWDQKRKGKELEYPEDSRGWGREDRPMNEVGWHGAQAYLAWLNDREGSPDKAVYRLPTDVEWEYAARGGLDTPYGWEGKAFDAKKANCSVKGSALKTLPVIRQDSWANGFGLHDMIGNVWELAVYQDKRSGRFGVLRGGSWYYDPASCRASIRIVDQSISSRSDIGFRVCRGSPIDPPDAGPPHADTLGR